MSVDVIVPVGGDDPLRAEVLQKVLAHLESTRWPVVLARDDHRPFRRAFALNRAVEDSVADFVVINDGDTICPVAQMREAVRLADIAPGLVFAFTDYVRLNEDGSRGLVLHEPSSHGCVVIRRQDFLEVGGYNEDFVGWGPEDQDFNRRAGSVERVPGECIHLWHGPRRGDDSPLDTPEEFVGANWARLG